MSGDWIKMRGNLWDDPRVAKLCDIIEQSEAAVIGGLYWLWATSDQHSEDGIMPGLTLRQIDRKTGIQGLGSALVSVGWLIDHPDGVQIARFEEHNGTSAKKRCQTAQRVSNYKAANAKVTQSALPKEYESVSSALPREEKRREEKSNTEREADFDENLSKASQNASATPQPHPIDNRASEHIKPENQVDQKKPEAKAHRLPTGWEPKPETRAWAGRERPDLNLDKVLESFRDFWYAKGGKEGRKTDWDATLRNWVRREEKRRPMANAYRSSFAETDAVAKRKKYEEIHGVPHPANLVDSFGMRHGMVFEPAVVIEAEVLHLGVGT